MNWKQIASSILLGLAAQSASAACNYSNFTASPSQGYLICFTGCQAQIPTTLSCKTTSLCREHCSDAKDNTCAGNPINLSNGSKYQKETDYMGSGEYPLSVTRYYQSSRSSTQNGMGINWNGMS